MVRVPYFIIFLKKLRAFRRKMRGGKSIHVYVNTKYGLFELILVRKKRYLYNFIDINNMFFYYKLKL